MSPALHSITDYEPNPECPNHDPEGLVCEAHPDRPWTGHPYGTRVGASTGTSTAPESASDAESPEVSGLSRDSSDTLAATGASSADPSRLDDTCCGAPGMPCGCVRWVCGQIGAHQGCEVDDVRAIDHP